MINAVIIVLLVIIATMLFLLLGVACGVLNRIKDGINYNLTLDLQGDGDDGKQQNVHRHISNAQRYLHRSGFVPGMSDLCTCTRDG